MAHFQYLEVCISGNKISKLTGISIQYSIKSVCFRFSSVALTLNQ